MIPPRFRWGAAVVATLALAGCGRIVVLHDALSAAEHNDLGVAYERAGQIELAEREYKKALRRDARLVAARVNLGNLAAGRGRFREAEREYRRALRREPDDGDALNNLAAVLIQRGGDLDEAETLARRAIARGGRDSLYRATLDDVLRARAARSR